MPHFKMAFPPLIAVTLVGVLVKVGRGPGEAKPEMKTVVISYLFYKSLFSLSTFSSLLRLHERIEREAGGPDPLTKNRK